MTTKTAWIKIDPTTLPAPVAKKLAALHAAFEAVKVAKAAFDPELVALYTKSQGALPAGHELAVSHRFGLAVAIVPTEAAKPARGAISLAA